MNRQLRRAANSPIDLSWGVQHDLQDKNLVGLIDRFAKTASSCDSVDSILTHVYP